LPGGGEPGDDVERKQFLKTALGAGAGLLATRYISIADKDGSSDLRSALAGPIAHYRRMEHAVSSEHLAPAVEAHLTLARVTVDQHLRTPDGFSVLAEVAGMSAWIATDRGARATARTRYTEAVQHARQAGHSLLVAYMTASLGQFESDSGNPRLGLDYLDHAKALLDKSAPDSALAWLSSLRAITSAQLGDRKATISALKLADTLTSRQRGEPVWPWVFQFDRAKGAISEAAALGRLGDLSGAATAFRAAEPHVTGPKPRALALLDQAQVLVGTGQLGDGCATALEALRIGHEYGSARIMGKARTFRAALPANTVEARQLDEALDNVQHQET
jgi:hypothetical protein